MNLRRALLAAFALAALALLVPALARAYYLQNADVAVQVAPTGALLVTERITIGGAFHGAYRDIPLRRGESIDRISVAEGDRRYTRGGSTKLGSIDRSDTFNYETNEKRVRIVWHFLAAGEPRTYTISYRFEGLTVAYDDVADVNLKVWGPSWSEPLPNLTAAVQLPRPVALGPSYRVYGHPAWVNGVVARTPRAATLRAVNVPSHQWVEMRVVFPRRAADLDRGREGRPRERPGVDRARRKPTRGELPARPRSPRRREEPPRTNAPLSCASSRSAQRSPFCSSSGSSTAASAAPATTASTSRSRRPTREPALVPPLLRQSTDVGSQEFTATLFDLIRRGRYKSSPANTEKKIWGGLRHETVSDLLVTPGDESVPLADFEEPVAAVIDSVVDADGERLSEFREKIEKHRSSNATRFTSFKSKASGGDQGAEVVHGRRRGPARPGPGRLRGRRGRPALDRHRRLAARHAALERRRAGRDRRLRDRERGRAGASRSRGLGSGGGARRPARPRPSAGTRSDAT